MNDKKQNESIVAELSITYGIVSAMLILIFARALLLL